MTIRQQLSIELRFQPHAVYEEWVRLYNALLVWEPRLQPTYVDRLSDIHATGPEPWQETEIAELALRCSGDTPFTWTLLKLNDSNFGMTVERRRCEVAFSIAVPRPAEPLPTFFRELLQALVGALQPALAMLFNADSRGPEAEVVAEGLYALKHLPPIVYLDAEAVERAGGRERLHRAPCEVLDMLGDGILLVISEALWDQPSSIMEERIQAVEHYLGLTPTSPLVLISC